MNERTKMLCPVSDPIEREFYLLTLWKEFIQSKTSEETSVVGDQRRDQLAVWSKTSQETSVVSEDISVVGVNFIG